MIKFYQILFLLIVLYATKSTNFVQAELPAEEIVGGDIVDHTFNPYQVRLDGRYFLGGVVGPTVSAYDCGGSILDDYHIISAAHCFHDKDSNQWRNQTFLVEAGVTDFKDPYDRPNWVWAYVKKVYIPTMYFNDVLNGIKPPKGDIAVIQLDRSLNLAENSHFETVSLPSTIGYYSSFENEKAAISGYGVSKINKKVYRATGRQQQELIEDGKFRHAQTTVLGNFYCQKIWKKIHITDKHLCASVDQRDPSKPEGTCSGDSGGSLIYKYNNKNVVIGVLSGGGKECDDSLAPTIYTRVTVFEDFIKKALELDNNSNYYDPNITIRQFDLTDSNYLENLFYEFYESSSNEYNL